MSLDIAKHFIPFQSPIPRAQPLLVAVAAYRHSIAFMARLSQLLKGKEHRPMDKASKALGCQRLAGAGLWIVPTTNKILHRLDWAASATARKGETRRVQAASTAHLALAKLCTCFQATLHFPFSSKPFVGLLCPV